PATFSWIRDDGNAREDRPGQLLRGQLSAVLGVEARVRGSGPRGAGPAAAARYAVGALFAHPVLPQALQILLFPRLYRQERTRRRGLSRRPGARGGTLPANGGGGRAALALRLFRRRHAVIPQRRSTPGTV